jgi:hypothetical protein
MARTKAEIGDKLKELHAQTENAVRPRRNYTVNQALDDWLGNGLDGLAPSIFKLYRDTIGKALREELGVVELTKPTAGTAQKALESIASRCSSRNRHRSLTMCWCGRSGMPSGTT